MTKLTYETTMSLDGCTTGPDITLEDPLGVGGEGLHEWAFATRAFHEQHGRSGRGETGPDDDLLRESFQANGAMIMGRKMYSGGEGPWADDSNAMGWWGDTPPFGVPVFVLTHHEREPLELTGTTFHYVTDGIQSALDQAREAAGDKDVAVAGGAEAAQQYLNAGLVNQVRLHIAPVVFGSGTSLLAGINPSLRWEQIQAVGGNGVTHVTYRIS
jgi:dihydrofolate reductase